MPYSFESLPFVAEGKTKILRRSGPRLVDIFEKNNMTAGNGKRHELIPGKGKICAAVSATLFGLLTRQRIPNCFVEAVVPGINRAEEGIMAPFEVVERRVADGSYCKRNPGVRSGTRLHVPIVEYYLKTRDRNFHGIALPDDDPLVMRVGEDGLDVVHPALIESSAEQAASLVHIPSDVIYGASGMYPFQFMTDMTHAVGEVLEEHWANVGTTLIDFKIEFARKADGTLGVADSLSPDEMRLLTNEGRMPCKEPFRKGAAVDEMVELYTEALIRCKQM